MKIEIEQDGYKAIYEFKQQDINFVEFLFNLDRLLHSFDYSFDSELQITEYE